MHATRGGDEPRTELEGGEMRGQQDHPTPCRLPSIELGEAVETHQFEQP